MFFVYFLLVLLFSDCFLICFFLRSLSSQKDGSQQAALIKWYETECKEMKETEREAVDTARKVRLDDCAATLPLLFVGFSNCQVLRHSSPTFRVPGF